MTPGTTNLLISAFSEIALINASVSGKEKTSDWKLTEYRPTTKDMSDSVSIAERVSVQIPPHFLSVFFVYEVIHVFRQILLTL